MKKGDIIATRAGGWWGLLVLFVTGSPYTHVSLFAGDGKVIEATWDGPVREAPLPSVYKCYTMDLTDRERDILIRWAYTRIGKRYSWTQFVFAAFRGMGRWRRVSKVRGYICTSLVAEGYRKIRKRVADAVAAPCEIVESSVLREA